MFGLLSVSAGAVYYDAPAAGMQADDNYINGAAYAASTVALSILGGSSGYADELAAYQETYNADYNPSIVSYVSDNGTRSDGLGLEYNMFAMSAGLVAIAEEVENICDATGKTTRYEQSAYEIATDYDKFNRGLYYWAQSEFENGGLTEINYASSLAYDADAGQWLVSEGSGRQVQYACGIANDIYDIIAAEGTRELVTVEIASDNSQGGGMGGLGQIMGMFSGGPGGMGGPGGPGGMGGMGGMSRNTQPQQTAPQDKYDVDRWRRADEAEPSALQQVQQDWQRRQEEKKTKNPFVRLFGRKRKKQNGPPEEARPEHRTPAPAQPNKILRPSESEPEAAAPAPKQPAPPVQSAAVRRFFTEDPINSCLLCGDSLSMGPLSLGQTARRRPADMAEAFAGEMPAESFMSARKAETERRKYEVHIVGSEEKRAPLPADAPAKE